MVSSGASRYRTQPPDVLVPVVAFSYTSIVTAFIVGAHSTAVNQLSYKLLLKLELHKLCATQLRRGSAIRSPSRFEFDGARP